MYVVQQMSADLHNQVCGRHAAEQFCSVRWWMLALIYCLSCTRSSSVFLLACALAHSGTNKHGKSESVQKQLAFQKQQHMLRWQQNYSESFIISSTVANPGISYNLNNVHPSVCVSLRLFGAILIKPIATKYWMHTSITSSIAMGHFTMERGQGHLK